MVSPATPALWMGRGQYWMMDAPTKTEKALRSGLKVVAGGFGASELVVLEAQPEMPASARTMPARGRAWRVLPRASGGRGVLRALRGRLRDFDADERGFTG